MFIDTLYAKLQQLANTPGTNDKLAILKTLDEHELLTVKMAIDPAINYFIAKLDDVPAGTESWDLRVEGLLDALADRTISGNAARDAVHNALSRLKPEHADVLRRVILKDLRVGVGATLLNKAFPGSIYVLPYMRCSLRDKSNLDKWSEEIWAAGVISDLKCDGMFAALSTCKHGSVVLMSRQGSTFPADALPDLIQPRAELEGTQLHGELLVRGPDGAVLERQIGNGMLNSLLQGGTLEPGHTAHYVVWDLIPLDHAVDGGKSDTPLAVRRGTLEGAVEGLPGISVVPYRVVHSKEEAMAHYLEVLGAGQEGTVVKNPQGIWKDTTSKDCVKFKLEVDVELKLVGFLPGTGKNADTFGSIKLRSADDLLEVDVTGFTDAKRADIWTRRETLLAKAQVFTIRGNQLLFPSPSNPLHSLFLPRVIEERLDKDTADTLDQIKAQFDNAVKGK